MALVVKTSRTVEVGRKEREREKEEGEEKTELH